ncbi:hypothetical protein [Parvibaculum sp.]|uniref:hypothetical protein n=1 Tax=Parvibaculum sp. TaxID=2024848 RepID=UPI002628C493|nr:hypothetical protein [Parvibaculum sp.]MCW5728146.1 hypothetical protein [Parvibaculum sp.]
MPEPETEAATETEASEARSTPDDLDTSHLDFLEEELKAEAGIGVVGGGARMEAGLISKEDFFGIFQVCFQVPNLMPIPPFPLESLPIKPEERDAARAASDAIYDIAAETAYLRWLVEPGSIWMQRALAIGPFVAVKFAAMRAEIAARHAKDVSPRATKPEPGEAADEPEPGEKSDASTVLEFPA